MLLNQTMSPLGRLLDRMRAKDDIVAKLPSCQPGPARTPCPDQTILCRRCAAIRAAAMLPSPDPTNLSLPWTLPWYQSVDEASCLEVQLRCDRDRLRVSR